MKRLPLYTSLLVLAFLGAGAQGVSGAERTPAWGWKAEEGLGAPKRPVRPPSEKKEKWNAAVVAPAPNSAANGSKADMEVQPAPAPETSPGVKSYCDNIADAALDARFLSQKAELTRLEEELAQRTAQLEAKRAEYQEWLKRRDEFINKAEGSLVKLYSKIKPDSAAPQLAALDEEAAAALLLKLSAKVSSAILDQMETAKAARLISVMMGAARPADQAPEKAPARNASAGLPAAEAGQRPDNGKRS